MIYTLSDFNPLKTKIRLMLNKDSVSIAQTTQRVLLRKTNRGCIKMCLL